MEDLFGLGAEASAGGETAVGSVSANLSITVESTTRSIIVRGRKPDLDVIDAVLKEIDVKTDQVLIEAFIVEATSTFQRDLGTRIGAITKRGTPGVVVEGSDPKPFFDCFGTDSSRFVPTMERIHHGGL